MFSLVLHPLELFIVLFIGLAVIVELGLRLRLGSSAFDDEHQSLTKSAREA